MDNVEIEAILSLLRPDFSSLADSISNYLPLQRQMSGGSVDKLRGYLPLSQLKPQLFEMFRKTSWSVHGYWEMNGGVECLSVVIRRKQFVENDLLVSAGNIAYHVTPEPSLERLLREGIVCGCALGNVPKRKEWFDAPFHVHVSLSEADARWWAGRLHPNQPVAIVPIRLDGSPPIRLIHDPYSDGYIVEENAIPPHLLLSGDVTVVNEPSPTEKS
jgi:hypothetical protein